MQTVDGETNSSPNKSCIDSTGNNSACKRAPPLGRRKIYANMKGDKHKNEGTPEKCETIYQGEERALSTHGSHEQKSWCTATCILIVLSAVKKYARV